MPMKLAGGGHSNHATPTRGSVFVVEEELQEPQNRNGVEIITTERDPEGLRTSPAPVEFTHSKTGSGDGCNPRLNAAALMDLPPWSPDRTSRVLRPWLPAPRPWQWTEIWDRSSPTPAARQNANPCHSSSTRRPFLLRLSSQLTFFTRPISYIYYRRYVEICETLR